MKVVLYKNPYDEPKLYGIISDDKVEEFLKTVVKSIESDYDRSYFREASDYEKDPLGDNINIDVYVVLGEYNNGEYKEDEYKTFFEFKEFKMDSFENKFNYFELN